MPFKFVDDGAPEADDYASNYVWVDLEADRDRVKRPRAAKPTALKAKRPDKFPGWTRRLWSFG